MIIFLNKVKKSNLQKLYSVNHFIFKNVNFKTN